MDTAILKILARTDTNNLPAIPQVLLDLIELFQSSDFSFDDLARIISQDASLSSKVLAAANSSFYRQWGDLKDLNRVLVVLGLNTLKTIVMTSVVQQFFNQIPLSQQHFLDVIWNRSLSCAHIARRLAVLTAYESPDQAYLTGLLHRLGQLVLLQCFPKEYPSLLSEHSEDINESLEKKTIGTSQNEIAAYLIESWKTRSYMADAVLYQNKPAQSVLDSPALVKLINLAAQLSMINSKNQQNIFERAYLLFGLNQAIVEEILADTKTQVETTAGSLGLSGTGSDASGSGLRNRQDERNAIQKRLADHVKNIGLIGAISQSNEIPAKLAKVIAQIQRDLNILFGFHTSTLFLYNPDTNTLEGYHFGEQETEKLWSTLSISLKENRSIVANALLKNQMLDTFSTPLPDPTPVVDHQICRLLNTEGMLAIPLVSPPQRLGVIVTGLNPSDSRKINTKKGMIALFASEATAALLNHKTVTQRMQDSINATRTGFQLHAKKISHEASNPLSIINNYLYLLGMKLGDQGPDEIKLIQEEINRVGDIILRLSDTPADTEADDNYIDINQVIKDLVTLFQGGLFAANQIQTDLKLDDKLPLISTSHTKLKQLLTNLLKNAAEALAGGGKITIMSRDRVYLGSKCCIEIRISDDGPGLSDEIKNHLFTPVTSSKGAGHSGLGLTITKTLVDELAGTISCDSTSADGTTFQIFLPRKTKS
ncbi:MAG: HDOD domain-containing protein [Gammaproteobacteria bacterium]